MGDAGVATSSPGHPSPCQAKGSPGLAPQVRSTVGVHHGDIPWAQPGWGILPFLGGKGRWRSSNTWGRRSPQQGLGVMSFQGKRGRGGAEGNGGGKEGDGRKTDPAKG